MNTSTIIISISILALFALPFIVAGRSQKSKNKRLFQALSAIAKAHGTAISEYEVCGSFALGLNESKSQLFFYRLSKEPIEHSIDLGGIQKCRTSITNSAGKSSADNYSVIDRLSLCLSYKDKAKSDMFLELYNSADNMQLNDEILFAEKWTTKINSLLKSQAN